MKFNPFTQEQTQRLMNNGWRQLRASGFHLPMMLDFPPVVRVNCDADGSFWLLSLVDPIYCKDAAWGAYFPEGYAPAEYRWFKLWLFRQDDYMSHEELHDERPLSVVVAAIAAGEED